MVDLKTSVLKQKIRFYSLNAIHFYQQLLRNQYLSHEELTQLNWEKRRRILAYAWDTVPYYQEKYSLEGIKRQDILAITLEDFLLLPVLTRREIKNNFEKFVSKGVSKRRLKLIRTGGSTGEPIKVFHEPGDCSEKHK
jgi:phenylacetate-CoA ligase